MNYWNKLYLKNKHHSIWPWSDVVSKINNIKKKIKNKNISILELGCGAGANIPFFIQNKINYHGVDFSKHIIKKLKKKFIKISKNLICGNILDNHFKEKKFEIILDRAAITHNDLNSIENIIKNVNLYLKPGGYFIGIDWYSTKYLKNKNKNKFQKFNEGMFSQVGGVSFFDKKLIKKIFKDFKILELEEKVVFDKINNEIKVASWSIIAKKI